jgi:phosphoglycerate-specific signal transduction histidine kinase
MTENELAILSDQLLALTRLIREAMDAPESENLHDLLNQYEQITNQIKQFARINKAAVLRCARLHDVLVQEGELLARATKMQDHLLNELHATRNSMAINAAYSPE